MTNQLPTRYALRDYQRECLDAIVKSYARGRKRLLISLPTGTGKTIVFSRFPEAITGQRRLLILTHRIELIEQTREKIEAINPGLSVGIEQARSRAGEARIVIASIQTLARGRVAGFDPSEFWGVIVDEAHHAVADSYRRVLDHFGPEAKVAGFTATPRRGDEIGLGGAFEEITYSRGLGEMIDGGWLCRLRAYRVLTSTCLDGVATRHGDFAESDLSRAVDTPDRNAVVVRALLDMAKDRRSLVFCAGIDHAQALAEDLERAGVRAAAVWGEMPMEDRHQVLAAFRRGELDAVTNVGVLTEGYDDPGISCVIMARPTKSSLLYTQMVGRGTRLHPSKPDLLVLDVVDNYRQHTLATINSLFGLPATYNPAGGDVLRQAQRLDGLPSTVSRSGLLGPGDVEARYEAIELLRRRAAQEAQRRAESAQRDAQRRAESAQREAQRRAEVDQWLKDQEARAAALRERWAALGINGVCVHADGSFSYEVPPELEGIASMAWIADGSGGFLLPFGRQHRLSVRPTLLGGYEIVSRRGSDEDCRGGTWTLPEAIREAEQDADQMYPDKIGLLHLDARWREDEPSLKQQALFERLDLGVPCTKGCGSYAQSALAVAGVLPEYEYRKVPRTLRLGVIRASGAIRSFVTAGFHVAYLREFAAIRDSHTDREACRWLGEPDNVWLIPADAFMRMHHEILDKFGPVTLTTDVPYDCMGLYSHDPHTLAKLQESYRTWMNARSQRAAG